jgi:hypothetical protein
MGQGIGVCFLPVTISPNSPEFSGKTHHEGEYGARRMHEVPLYPFLPRPGAPEPKVRGG